MIYEFTWDGRNSGEKEDRPEGMMPWYFLQEIRTRSKNKN